MNLEYFPHFLKSNYPSSSSFSDEEVAEIGVAFKQYLEDTFKSNPDKLEKIWKIDARDVIMHQVNKHPFMVNGYHPALILHFDKFIKQQIQIQETNEIN